MRGCKPFECNQLAVSRATQLVARGQQELTVDDIVDTGLVARGQHKLTGDHCELLEGTDSYHQSVYKRVCSYMRLVQDVRYVLCIKYSICIFVYDCNVFLNLFVLFIQESGIRNN